MSDFTGKTCGVQLRNGDCETPSLPDTPFPICSRHFIQICAYRAEMDTSPREPQRYRAQDRRAKYRKPEPKGVVYYLRLDVDMVKIGYSQNVLQRIEQLYRRPQDLLAVEPGDRTIEHARHVQFKHLRGSGERFKLGNDLRDHIDMLRTTGAAKRAKIPYALAASLE